MSRTTNRLAKSAMNGSTAASSEELETLVASLVERSLAESAVFGGARPALPFGEGVLSKGLPRDACALAFRGMPGVGKTACLGEVGRLLRSGGAERDAVLYFDCGDARLRGGGPMLPVLVVDALFRMRPRLRDRRCYLLLDNVDAVPGWRGALARVLGAYDVRFVVAGCDLGDAGDTAATASAPVPAGPIPAGAPVPAGPVIAFRQLLPLGFADYLSWSLARSGSAVADAASPSDLVDGYLACGGLAAGVLSEEGRRCAALQSLALDAVARDAFLRGRGSSVAAGRRHGLDAETCLAFACLALGAASGPLSVTRAAERLKEGGLPCSRASLSAALDRLEALGLVRFLGEFGCENPGDGRLPRTVFAADHGLLGAFSPLGTPRPADVMRDAVYLELVRRRLGERVRTLRVSPGKHVDFAICDLVSRHAGGNVDPADLAASRAVVALVHVVDEAASPRALRSAAGLLGHAMLRCGLDEGTLVTYGLEETLDTPSGRVRAVPLWKWLLGGDGA